MGRRTAVCAIDSVAGPSRAGSGMRDSLLA